MPEAMDPRSDHPETQVASIQRITRAIRSRVPAAEIYRLITEEARDLVRASTTALGLRSEDGTVIDFVACAGEGVTEMVGLQIGSDHSLAQAALRTGQATLFHTGGGETLMPGYRSAAVAPMVRDGSIIGALFALRKETGVPFGNADVNTLSLLSDQAVLAVVLEEAAGLCAEKSRESAVLYDAVRTVSSSLNIAEVTNAVLDTVCEHFPNHAAALFLLNDERTHLFIAAERGMGDEERDIQLAADSPVTSSILESGRTLRIEDVLSEPTTESVTIPGRTRSAIVAPVTSRQDTLGLLLVSSSQPRAYSANDETLLSAVAAQSGIAIANAWLYEDAMRRAEEAAALYDLSQHVNATLHLDRVFQFVADSVVNLLKVDKFALMLVDPHDRRLTCRVCRGVDAERFERIRPRAGEGIAGWVLEWMTPTAVSDVAADARNATAPIHGEGIVSTICVPMAVGNEEIGVMLAMSSRRRLFTVAEMELLYTIANQAAVAIANATQYQDARSKSAEMRRYFHRIARALGSAFEAQDVPQLLADLVVEVMRADRCAIYRVEGEQLRLQATSRFRASAPPDPSIAVGEGLTGWVARKGRSLTVEQLSEDPRSRAHTWLSRETLCSYLAVPLKSDRKTVGVVEIFCQDRRSFVDDEVRLVSQFARRARVAEKLVLEGAM